MYFAIFLILLTLITLKNGAAGCLTFILASVLFITASTILFDNGMVYGLVFMAGLAVYQIFKRSEVS